MNTYSMEQIADPMEFSDVIPDLPDTGREELSIDEILQADNIAALLSKTKLNEISSLCRTEYDIDLGTMRDRIDTWNQVMKSVGLKRKDNRSEYLSNTRLPLISQSVIGFYSRAFPSLFKDGKPVQGYYPEAGTDPTGKEQAERVGDHMSWQLIYEMKGWKQNTAKLLMMLAAIGNGYKKIWYDPITKKECSVFVSPFDLIINANAVDYESCPRKTQIIELYPNEVIGKMRLGEFLNNPSIAVSDGYLPEINHNEERGQGNPSDTSGKIQFLEQHRFLDLDNDGYQEPYIVLFHAATDTIVKITKRFDENDIRANQLNEIYHIDYFEHFVKFSFIPDPEGSVFDIGFGTLFLEYSDVIDRSVNRLMDSALYNLANIYFGKKGIRGKDGNTIDLKPFTINELDFMGDDINKVMTRFDINPPSPIIFELLKLMINLQKESTASVEVLAGRQPHSDMPATSVMALIEQALTMFSMIFEGIYGSFNQEYKKILQLKRKHIDTLEEMIVYGNQKKAMRSDYLNESIDVVPVADQKAVTNMQKVAKAEATLRFLGQGYNDKEIVRQYLEALGISNVDRIIPDQTPPPPQMIIEEKKMKNEERKIVIDEHRMAAEVMKTKAEILKLRADAIKSIADAEAKEAGPQLQEYDNKVKELEAEIERRDDIVGALLQEPENV